MALAELPAHHIARNTQLGEHSAQLHGSNGEVGPLKQYENRKFRPAPSAIDGMMKTTTETGDLGQLASKPTPRNVSSLRNTSAISNRGESSRSQQRPRNLDRRQPIVSNPPAYHPMQYDPNAAYSNGESGRSEYGGGVYYDRPDQSTYEEHQAWSMTQRSYVSHSLTNRHPHSNGMYERRVQPPGSRPRSPFAYPTRLKRPGYRPSSPALADVYRSRYEVGVDSRSSSPASSHSRQRARIPWQQHLNHSDPMMRSFPTAPGHDYANYQYRSPAPSQASTPRPTSSLRSVTSWSRLPQAQPPTAGIWNLPETSQSTPVFYDYSEGFEESPGYQHNMHGIVNDELVEASSINEAINTSMSDEHSHLTELSAETTEHKPLLKRSSSQSQSTHAKSATDGLARSFSETIFNRGKRFTTGSLLPQEQASKHTQHHAGRPASVPGPLSHSSPDNPSAHQCVEPLSLEIFAKFDTANRQEASRDDPVVQERSSPSTGSMCTAESNSHLMEEDADSETDKLDARIRPVANTEFPSNAELVDLHTQSRNSSICGTRSTSNSAAIISPTPERSILSQDNRERFSRLLNIDDSSALKEDVSKQPWHMQIPQDVERHRPLRTTQGSLFDHVTINTSILEDSGSDREHELSPSLMQTFGGRGRDNSKSIPAVTTPVAERDNLSSSSNDEGSSQQKSERTFSSALPASGPKTAIPEAIVRKASRSPSASHNRHARIIGSTERASSHDSKGLSSVPVDQRTVIAISPPATSDALDLPFSFSPIIQYRDYEDSVSESGGESSTHVESKESKVAPTKPPSSHSTLALENDSVASSHGSRPWNDDCNYPWSDQLPDLAVSIPAPPSDARGRTGILPRFKLRIQRASPSTDSARLVKRRGSSDETSSRRNSRLFSRQVSTLKSRPKPRFSNSPGEINSSHAIKPAPLQTRFVEGFNLPSRISGAAGSPTITLSPPSPVQEVRSFFSDDSSQRGQKASLRKRLSEFKSRRHSHFDSNGNVQVPERGQSKSVLRKPRSSDRLSRQSHRTPHSTHTVGSNFLRFRTVRFWWHRSEGKIRAWTSRIWKPSGRK
ncbi:MAG: hypothetical protein OHK93_000987 [Ramalina farinacea]|uniref:Uncharacterized protein n=1 Tax=Ramalina farinacea TaxID=258253 RepID=A0AA43QQD2_9LECA|nr:hypothetical protein [Ramalina farinacea]